MKVGFLKEILSFVGFDEEDRLSMGKLKEWIGPRLDEMAEAFYKAILRHPDARQVLSGPEQVERLKELLKLWAIKLCTGPYDEEYLRVRARIGRVHVQIGLPQRYMLTAMSVLRQFFSRVAQEGAATVHEARAVKRAVGRLLDCELAIMLETYHEDLQGKLARHERLAALGSVAVTINHEMKNPLGVLKTSVDALRRQISSLAAKDGKERVLRHLEKLDRNLNKMQANITSLLEFARYSEPTLEESDIRHVIDGALEEAALPPGIKVEKRYDPSLPLTLADPHQLARVFVNLARNAAEAMEGNGSLTVEARSMPGSILVTIADTGPGVPDDLREQVFQPLWTGKPGGTGMGLAICRATVESHRGRIWVEPGEPGEPGARFQVQLPSRGESIRGRE